MIKMHAERIIGIKKCSEADLGINTTSHQTHLGLSERVFTFLGNDENLSNCIFLYDNHIQKLPCPYNKILGENGKYRSPKIRLGLNKNETVLAKIRKIAKKEKNSLYLVYFALEDKTPVFFLIKDNTEDCSKFLSLGIDLKSLNRPQEITYKNPKYKNIVLYLTRLIDEKINYSQEKKEQELERIIQMGPSATIKTKTKFTAKEIEKAKIDFATIGRKGEEFIDEKLNRLQGNGTISQYFWNNQEKESYEPYDFKIVKNGKLFYIEVKTTGFDFSQSMIFSRNEIDFAMEHIDQYLIYRVYKTKQGDFCCRICDSAVQIIERIHETLSEAEESIRDIVDISLLNIAIKPNSIYFKNIN